MTNHTTLGKALNTCMTPALEFVPKCCCALAPMRASKREELSGREVAGMCGNNVEKSSLCLRIPKGLKRVEMCLCDVHREKIAAVSSRSSRMRRSRDESSERL